MMHEQPIVQFLRQYLPQFFPVLTTPGHGLHRTGIGGYVSHGRYHPTGRAADIFLSAGSAYERRIGNALFNLFIQQGRRLQVEHVIWNGRIWSLKRGGPRHYTGSHPHSNHIHVYFAPAGGSQWPMWLLDYFTEIVIAMGDAAIA